MSKPDFGFRRGAVSWPLAAGITAATIALVALVTIAIKSLGGAAESVDSDRGLSISLVVEPFEVGDSVGGSWDAAGFAESLATRLSLVRGIHATATVGHDARYVLYGSVAMKDGRLVLATRLGRDAERDTVWTATFWRSTTSGTTVLSDLATAVAEAVLGETAREALTPKREKR